MPDFAALEQAEGRRVRLTHTGSGDEYYGLVEVVDGSELKVRFYPDENLEVGADYDVCVFHGPCKMSFLAQLHGFSSGMAKLTLRSEVKQSEGRAQKRIPACRLEVVLKLEDKERTTWLVDVSEQGLSLDAKSEVPIGTHCRAFMQFPKGDIELDVRICNCNLRADKEGYRVGLQVVSDESLTAWRKAFDTLTGLWAA